MRRPSAPALLAFGVALGFAVPALSALLRPLLPVCVAVFVTGTFLRADPILLRRAVGSLHTGLLLPLLAVVSLPLVAVVLLPAFGVPAAAVAAIVLALASPPSTGNAAMARMFGYGGETPFAIILLTTLAAPVTLPLVAATVGAQVDPLALAKGLALLLGVAGGTAVVLRRVAPLRVAGAQAGIDRVTVAALLFYAVASMDGVQAFARSDPGLFAGLLAAAFAANLVGQAAGAILAPREPGARIALALTFGNRNVGLPWAVLGSALSPTTTVFFAMAQIPIFVLPWLIRRAAQRPSPPRQ